MEAAFTALNTATCALVLLVSSQFTLAIAQTARKLAQQEHVMTAKASSTSRADACSSATDKAYNLCMIQGFFKIGQVNCDCTQSEISGAPRSECVGTAACEK